MNKIVKNVLKVIALVIILNVTMGAYEVNAKERTNEQPNKWFVEEIKEARSKGFFVEDLEGEYKRAITRGEYVALAIRLLKLTNYDIVYSESINFSDIQSNKYYSEIVTAYNNEIITGYSDYTFKPDQLITRQEISKLMLNLVWKLKPEAITYKYKNNFEDSELIARWAEEAVNYCSGINVIKGELSNELYYLRPNDSVTVEQAIVIMYRLGKYLDVIDNNYDMGNIVITKYDEKISEDKPEITKTKEETTVINEFALNVGKEFANKLKEYVKSNKLELIYMDEHNASAIDEQGQRIYISNYIDNKISLSIYIKDTDKRNNMYKIFEEFSNIVNVDIKNIEAKDNTGDVNLASEQYKLEVTF